MFNNWLTDIPDGQYPSVISSDLGSEFNFQRSLPLVRTEEDPTILHQ